MPVFLTEPASLAGQGCEELTRAPDFSGGFSFGRALTDPGSLHSPAWLFNIAGIFVAI